MKQHLLSHSANWLLVVLVGGTIILSAWIHQLAGMTLPLPWDDEFSFVWPARAMAEHGTLHAPELNPERDIFWMPPGYAVALAGVFKVFGFSLPVARGFSWFCAAAALVVLVVFLARYPLRLLTSALLCWIFVNGAFVTIGNVARMDALCLLMGAGTLLLLQRERRWAGLAIAALAILVHPNGVYFGAVAVAWILVDRGLQWGRPRGTDWVLLGIAGAAWAAYLAYVAAHWPSFQADMAMQFARKARRAPWTELMTATSLGVLGLYLVLGVLSLIRDRSRLLPLAFSGACFFLVLFGHEMWYEVFNSLAFFLLACSVLWALWDVLSRRRVVAVAATGLALLPMLLFFYRHGFIEGLRGFPRDMEWGWGMRMSDGADYFTRNDAEAIAAQLERYAAPGRMLRVQFYPRGDALLADRYLPKGFLPFFPHFTETKPDILIARKSRYIPTWVDKVRVQVFQQIPEETEAFRERDETEMWYLADLRTRPASTTAPKIDGEHEPIRQ